MLHLGRLQQSLTMSGRQRRSCTTAAPTAMNAVDQVRRIAVAQMTSTGDQLANFEICRTLAETREGVAVHDRSIIAGMLFLPEACSFIGENAEQTVAAASSLDDPDAPVIGRFRNLAKRLRMWISIGGFQESQPDPSKLFNTHIMLNDSGQLVACYRKIHLFDVNVSGSPMLMESHSTTPGNQVVYCEAPAGRIGMGICYDLRFPGLSDALRFEHGCDILTYPSAFTVKTGQAHWELLLRARAVETQCYVIAAAQAGQHNSKRQSYGHALVVDPWGDIVAKLDDSQATGIAVAEIDHERIRAVRERMPVHQHREALKACRQSVL